MENNNMVVVNEKENFAKEITDNKQVMFCSVKEDSANGKALVFKAMNNPTRKVADYIGKQIKLKDIFVETVDIADEQTGEVDQVPRVVLFDDKGETYEAVSKGMFNALQKLIGVFGMPTYEEPITIEIKQKSVKKGSMLTFDIVC